VDIDVDDCDPGALERLEDTLAIIKRVYHERISWHVCESVQTSRGDHAISVRRLQPHNLNEPADQATLRMLHGSLWLLTVTLTTRDKYIAFAR
jgi:hypothetical protein